MAALLQALIAYKLALDETTVAMINLMLNYLCSPIAEVFGVDFHFKRLELNFDSFIPLALTRAAEKRQTAFFGFIYARLRDNLRIKHHRISRSSSALVKKGDDALAYANHIRSHADTAFSMRHQRIKQVLCDLPIFFRCDL